MDDATKPEAVEPGRQEREAGADGSLVDERQGVSLGQEDARRNEEERLKAKVAKLRSNLQGKLNNKPIDDEESMRKDKTTLGVTNVSGSERWFNGETKQSEIAIEQQDGVLVANVKLPFEGNYDAKNFKGVLAEYNSDAKTYSGVAVFQVRMTGGRFDVQNVDFQAMSPGTGHDAGRMASEAVKADVVDSLSR